LNAPSSTAELITQSRDLRDIVEAARSTGTVGLDTEFFRERTYRARLCLAQLSVGDTVVLVDPLSSVDMNPVAALVGDPSVNVVVHAGGQDLELFHEQFGAHPQNIFDVQRAAGFAGYGASMSYGALVGGVLGVSLRKGESYTDWCRRPLTAEQLDYAADDVRFLLPVAARLRVKLEELGRLEWVEEEMRAMERSASSPVGVDEAWRKVSGRGSLSGSQTAVLREVAWWREREAMARDVPRGWIVKDPTLIEMARRAPTTRQALARLRGVNAKEIERSHEELIAAIQRGRAAPAILHGAEPPRHAFARARMLSGLADSLLRARCERASIASELVATRGELESLLADVLGGPQAVRDHRLLEGWRKDLAGDAIVDLALGRLALRASDVPPYVEELRL
jgi:ribonuclease D